jgi:hypothetical protein
LAFSILQCDAGTVWRVQKRQRRAPALHYSAFSSDTSAHDDLTDTIAAIERKVGTLDAQIDIIQEGTDTAVIKALGYDDPAVAKLDLYDLKAEKLLQEQLLDFYLRQARTLQIEKQPSALGSYKLLNASSTDTSACPFISLVISPFISLMLTAICFTILNAKSGDYSEDRS